MVAGSSVLRGGQVPRSEVLGFALVLPWETPSVLCCRVAMMAVQELRSPSTKYACVGWIVVACADPALTHLLLGPCAPRVASPPVRQRLNPHSRVVKELGSLDAGGDFELVICDKLLAAAVQHQVQFYAAGSFSCPGMSSDLGLGIHERSYFRCGLKPRNFLAAAKIWSLSCIITWIEIRNTILDIYLFNIWSEKKHCKITTQLSPSPILCGAVLLIAQVKFCADGNDLVELVQLPACWNQNSSFLLQVVFLHIQKGPTGPVLGFFTRFEDDLHCLRWYGHVLENNEMENHLHHHPGVPPKLKKISSCEYTNLALHQLYMEIFESGSWSIGYAARSLNYFTRNHLSCVNQWSKVSMIVTSPPRCYVCTQNSSINGSPIGISEQAYLICHYCTRSSLIDGTHTEDAVPLLFGLCHRRWTTAPSLLILRFNSGDPLSLSSVKAIQYLQLNHKPQVHTPDRPLGESPAGHQLVWSIKEALEDCNCSKFEPELSTDKRSLFDSNCSLRYLLCKMSPSRIRYVQLRTAGSCSFLSFVILYSDG